MGGADVYCCLCGGPCGPAYWEVPEEEDDEEATAEDSTAAEEDNSDDNNKSGKIDEDEEFEEEEEYDPAIIKPEDSVMAWLSNVRIIGENPDSTSPSKEFISGLASEHDVGIFDAEAGTDPNFPEDFDGPIDTYKWEGNYGFCLPFHQACYNLLCRAALSEALNKAALYQALKSLASPQSYQNCLDIDYGAVGEFHEQYWVCKRGHEYIMFSPTEIPALEKFCSELPRSRSDLGNTAVSIKTANELDPFSRLAAEIQLAVIDQLDTADCMRLRRASRTVNNLELSSSFWKLRIRRDMPWLYDMPIASDPGLVDWTRFYRDMYCGSGMSRQTEGRIMGLVNRRRIWEHILPQILVPYQEKKRQYDETATSEPITLQGATFTRGIRLISGKPTETTVTKHALISEFADISSSCPVLFFRFRTGSGEVMSITVGEPAPCIDTNGTEGQSVSIPKDDWITGFIFTSRETSDEGQENGFSRRLVGIEVVFTHQAAVRLGDQNGDKRLIHVTPQNICVGFSTVTLDDGRLFQLSLIEQPKSKVHQSHRVRASPPAGINLHAGDYLWRESLLPLPLLAEAYASGYWNHNMVEDLSPMEALVFGTTEAELSSITSLSADTQLGGFQVTYRNRPTRSIGPRLQALKTLEIDGANGERIVSVLHKTSHLPLFIRFVTNHNRQLVVGDGEASRPQVSETTGNLVGMYGWWSNRGSPKATLGAFGRLNSPDISFEWTRDTDKLCDSSGFYWEPTAPSTQWHEFGPILGQREEANRPVRRLPSAPGPGSAVCMLDCTRPLSEIQITTCHSPPEQQLALCRLSFAYADTGETATVGPSGFPPPPTDSEGVGGHHWCWCSLAFNRNTVMKELENGPHFQHTNYKFASLQLASLRVWLAADGGLSGLQFTGTESSLPVWTNCSGELGGESAEIKFMVEGGGNASGLKFFFDPTRRSVSREDSIVVAVQELQRD